MSLIEANLPDGIYRGGTEYASKGRWYDCNLLRFRDGVKSPVGGWSKRSNDVVTGSARAMHTWNDLSLRGWIAVGTNSNLYIQSRGGANTDITPYGFVAGRPTAIQGGGWGTGTWGTGSWGTRRADVKGILPANVWTLDNWGQNLVAVFDTGTYPVEWTPAGAAWVTISGTATAGAATTITLDPSSSAADDAYNGLYIVIKGGTGAGQSRLISDYVGASKVATVSAAWATNPDATSVYDIRASGEIANSPKGVALCVTDERHLMIIGAVFDDPAISGGPLRVAWSDKENNTNWDVASTTSEAGYIDLQSNSELMAVVKVRGGVLILSKTDAFYGTYQGTQFVYGFQRVGSNCGVVGRKAISVVNGVAYWRGVNGFYAFDGYVRSLPCDVWEFFRQSANKTQVSKFWAMGNSRFDEIWWFDCDANNNEINRYFYMSLRDNHWSKGVIVRTCGADTGVFRDPLMVGTDGLIYEHEIGVNYDGALPYLESGPLEMGAGDNTLTVKQYIPDENTDGAITVTLKGRFWPNLPEFSSSTFVASSPCGVQFNARQVKIRYDSADGSDFRIGGYRFDVVARGKR